MAREWLLRGVDPEELKPDEKIAAPTTPKSKWENFWYHHKWTFWGSAFAVVVGIVLVVQLVTRDPADYQILMMTEQAYLDTEIALLEEMMTPYGQDLDGDGKVEISIQNCRIAKDTNQQYNSGFQMVQAHLATGDVLFFVWDKGAYDYFMDGLSNVLEDGVQFLTDVPGDGTGIIEEGKLYNWAEDPRRTGDLTRLPQDLYFGVRDTHGTAGDAGKMHQDCMALLEAFIKDQKTAQ